MAFGIGGPGGGFGGGPGGHGPGGHGPGFGGHGPGFGGHGPGFGGHGPGFGFGRGGGFFGFGHFGFNSTGSARGSTDGGFYNSISGMDDRYRFPEGAMVQNPTPPETGQEHVDLLLINLNSIERSAFWWGILAAVLCGLVILNAVFAGSVHLFWIILFTPALVLSPLINFVRFLMLDRYGRAFTNCFCTIIGIITIISAPICWLVGFGTPRAAFAYGLAFIAGSFFSTYVFQFARTSQNIRGFDDDSRTYRHRIIGASIAGRILETLIFIPCAFIGQQDGFRNFWLGVCLICLCSLIDAVLSPVAYLVRNWFVFHLSADYDFIDDGQNQQTS